MEQVTTSTEQNVAVSTEVVESLIVSETETIIHTTSESITVVTGLMGPKGRDGTLTTLSAMSDVDVSSIRDGSLLIYSTNVNKWQAGNTLNNQIMEAGQF